MTTITATLSIALLVFAASRIMAAEEVNGPSRVDRCLLRCIKPEYVAATQEEFKEIHPTNSLVGANLQMGVKRDVQSNLIPFPRIGRAYPQIWVPSYDTEEVNGPSRVDRCLLRCIKPEYVAATQEEFKEIHPTNSLVGANLQMGVKRDAVESNLYPFPRVGRAYPQIWVPSYDSVKRFGSGLIPFPRVGRSGTGPKRNGAGGGGSLWFGPRLGKRTLDKSPDPSTLEARPSYHDLYVAPNVDESPKPDWVV